MIGHQALHCLKTQQIIMTKNAYSIGKSRLIDIQFLSKTIFFYLSNVQAEQSWQQLIYLTIS